jgi:hypothetical protein
MASEARFGGRTLAALMFRSMVACSLFFALAALMAMAFARPALGQGTTTTYADGATKSQDTVVTHPDGSKSSETETEYDEGGRPTSETETIYDGTGHPTSEHKKTWVYDDKGRLIYFETSDETYGNGVIGGVKSGYRIRKKYKDDKDTEGTTTSEQEYSSVTGKWRDFDGDGGDVEPSKEPLQPLKPKIKARDRSKLDPSLLNRPLGEDTPAAGTQTPKPVTPEAETPSTGTGGKTSTGPTEVKTVAIAMPANAQAGDTITGTATDDPTEIAEMQEIPGIHITLVPVTQPAQTSSTTTQTGGDDTLAGVVVQVNGEKQPADKPLVAMLGPAAQTIAIELLTNDTEPRVIGQDSVPVTATTPGTTTPTEPGTAMTPRSTTPTETGTATTPRSTVPTETEDYEMPPVTKPGAVEVIHGATSGNANDMQIAVDGEPAKILTATPRSASWRVPADLTAGAESSVHTVVFTLKDPAGGAPKSVTFPMDAVQIGMSEGSSKLVKGQTNPVEVTVSIPKGLQASAWQSGTPSSDLVDLKTLAGGKSGLKSPKPKEEGFIAVLIENESPGVVRLGKTDTIVLQLHQKDFTNGSYTYNTTLKTIGAGSYVVRSRVVSFLKDAQGQASMSAGN